MALAAKPNVARDWARYPAVVQVDTQADVFAIGDVHGDCDRLVRLLAAAHIVRSDPSSPSRVSWSAGKAVLVFTGDMIDKGPKGPAVIALILALRTEAARAGGQVIALAGNHEVDFLRDPASEKAKEFALQLKDAGLDARVVASCGGDVGAFVCSLPFAARVNDWFFSHAGNSGGRTMARLISDLQTGYDKDGYETPELVAPDALIQARLDGKTPFWFAPRQATQPVDQAIAEYAAALGVAHFVQGHQHNELRFPDGEARKLGEIYQWRGRLFLIDAGLSQDIDESEGAVLRMRSGEASVVCPGGEIVNIWNNAGKPAASQGVACGR